MNGVRSDYIRPLCQSGDPEDWFAHPDSVQGRRARSTCKRCPLEKGCQGYALEQGIPGGIWGGLTEAQRERIWKQSGGRPTAFIDSIDAVIAPIINSRGMTDAWARKAAEEEDADPFTYDFSAEDGPDAA